jgi:UDP-glucose 4-epimerase
VANVVAANLLAMKSERPLLGATYNVGTGGRVSLLDLVAALNAIYGKSLEPEFRPVRAGDVRDSQACLKRIKAAIGYRPVVEFEEGLKRTVAAV